MVMYWRAKLAAVLQGPSWHELQSISLWNVSQQHCLSLSVCSSVWRLSCCITASDRKWKTSPIISPLWWGLCPVRIWAVALVLKDIFRVHVCWDGILEPCDEFELWCLRCVIRQALQTKATVSFALSNCSEAQSKKCWILPTKTSIDEQKYKITTQAWDKNKPQMSVVVTARWTHDRTQTAHSYATVSESCCLVQQSFWMDAR